MKRLFDTYMHGAKVMRDSQLKKSGYGMARVQSDFANNVRMSAKHMAQMQGQVYKGAVQQNKTMQTFGQVLQHFTPKGVQRTILKLKVNIQLFIGNVFGLKFPSLEANQTKLNKMNQEMGFEPMPKKPQQNQTQQQQSQEKVIDKTTIDISAEESQSNNSSKSDRQKKFDELLKSKDKSTQAQTPSRPQTAAERRAQFAAKYQNQYKQEQPSPIFKTGVVSQQDRMRHDIIDSPIQSKKVDKTDESKQQQIQEAKIVGQNYVQAQRPIDQNTSLAGQYLYQGQVQFAKVKNKINKVVNSVITKVQALLQKTKKRIRSGKVPTASEASSFIAKQVKKLSALSPQAFVQTVQTLREKVSSGMLRDLGKEKLFKFLDPIKERWNRLTGKAPPPPPKPESKLWQIVFNKSKTEVHEAVSKDFRGYMVAAHFDINEAKRALNSSKGNGLTANNGGASFSEKAKTEWSHFKQFSMNTVYNLYADGVLNRYVRRLHAGAAEQRERIPWTKRELAYMTFFGSVILLSVWDQKRRWQIESAPQVSQPQQVTVVIKDQPASKPSISILEEAQSIVQSTDGQIRVKIAEIELQKVQLELELEKLKTIRKAPH